jgi:hypothetical protein
MQAAIDVDVAGRYPDANARRPRVRQRLLWTGRRLQPRRVHMQQRLFSNRHKSMRRHSGADANAAAQRRTFTVSSWRFWSENLRIRFSYRANHLFSQRFRLLVRRYVARALDCNVSTLRNVRSALARHVPVRTAAHSVTIKK